ncbi:MAG: type IV pilin protein [Proteobacteria bacterium]|nr:type IV pilin protein [Pseudomonadota bacterium]
MHKHRNFGFTLIEMVIVVAIIAILSIVAYPSYAKHTYRSRRSDGQNFLMQVASAEERYYTNFNTYTTNLTGSGATGLGMAAATSSAGYYTVTVVAAGAGIGSGFSATATPQGLQAGDKWCATLTIDSAGNKTSTSTAGDSNGSCW